MSAIHNEGDPLDDLIYQFQDAIDAFVSNDVDLDVPETVPDWAGAKRNLRNHLRKLHRDIDRLEERLNRILNIGALLLELSPNDPKITGPVQEVLETAASVRDGVTPWRAKLRKRATVVGIAIASAAVSISLSEANPKMRLIGRKRTELISYYMLKRAME